MQNKHLRLLLMAVMTILMVLAISPAFAQDNGPVGNDATIGIEPNEPQPIVNGALQQVGADAVNLRSVPNEKVPGSVVRSLTKGTLFQPLADTGNGWQLIIVVSADGVYDFGGQGYISVSAAKPAAPSVDLKPVASQVCDIETYTPVQGWVHFGKRYVSYIPAEPCTVVLDGRINPADRDDNRKVHDLVDVVQVSNSGRVESTILNNGLLIWTEGTYARYPVGNEMNQPELNSTNAWTLVDGWIRDIRERLDARKDGPAWVLRHTRLDGSKVFFEQGQYPDDAAAGSKDYTSCDSLTDPVNLPANPLYVESTSKDIAHYVAAVGSQKCLTLFVGYRNHGLDSVPTISLLDGIVERFEYVKGRFWIFPVGSTYGTIGDYVTAGLPTYGFPSATVITVEDPSKALPATITVP